MARRTTNRKQIRGFAFVWTGITIVIGIVAFFGIYLAYDSTSADTLDDDGLSLPNTATDQPTAVAVIATPVPTLQPTDEPTVPPTQTPLPTEEPAVIAQAAEATPTEPFTSTPEPTPTVTMLPVNIPDFTVGIQVQQSIEFTEDFQRMWFNDVIGLGLHWYKQQIRWEDIERERGNYDWAILDFALPIASDMGLNVLISVTAAPDWARPAGVDLESEGPPTNIEDFTDFLAAMLERYPHMIHAIEVWNEPNLDREWMGPRGVSAGEYVAMLRAAYSTIKNIDPGIIVVSAALSPTGGLPPADGRERAIDDFAYLDQLIASGLLDHCDCIGAHHNGYNIGPSVPWDDVPPDPDAIFRGPFDDNKHHSWSLYSTLQTYANKIAVAGGQQRLCITEFGWASMEDLGEDYPEGFAFAMDNTLEEQATWFIEALDNMDEWDFVWLAMIWNLNYSVQAGWDSTNDNVPYSLIGPDFIQRPAMAAIRAWSARRQGQAEQ